MIQPWPDTRTYSTSPWSQLARQARYALQSRERTADQVALLLQRLRRDEARIESHLGRALRGVNVLEIGPGQGCERSRYLGRHNRVTALDMDTIARAGSMSDYVRMVRCNGLGRLLKTAGRKLLLVDRARRRAWQKALGVADLPEPKLLHGDICADPDLPEESFDVVVSWSVFEHLTHPGRAVENAIRFLRPGGVFYFGIHLYTSHTGHHDIRAFTGAEQELPLWGHLRRTTRHLLKPSAVLNELSLSQWRALFADKAPGAIEFREDYGAAELLRRLTPDVRHELAAYRDEELFTVEAFYLWRKPL